MLLAVINSLEIKAKAKEQAHDLHFIKTNHRIEKQKSYLKLINPTLSQDNLAMNDVEVDKCKKFDFNVVRSGGKTARHRQR